MNNLGSPLLSSGATADVPDSARIVIVGGGVVGASTAYHLARLGWRDIVLIDQGPLFHNWGSTSHAPGLMFQHNNSRELCRLAQWTVETYAEVSRLAHVPAFFQVGSLEVAASRERALDLKRKLGNAMAWGLEAELVDNAAVARLVPLLRTDDLFGALHVPSDANVNASALCETMARICREQGSLRVFEHTPLVAIEQARGRVQAVVTSRGRIATDLVLCAAGIWGPAVGRLAGIEIPLTPMQHLYARTGPLSELAGETAEIRHPMVRDQDRDIYFRQHADAYGIGNYGHRPMPVDVEAIPKRDDAAIFPFTPEHMMEALRAARHRMPCLAGASVARAFNGVFSFTPDGHALLGEKPDLRGFWVAEAVWVTHGGGVGRAMAEWLASGSPGLDLREMDINRFPSHATGRRHVIERSCQQYVEVYDILHPLDPPRAPRGLRTSPYHARLEALGAHFYESAGWERPRWYGANRARLEKLAAFPVRDGWSARNWSPLCAAEHLACREAAGLVDLTAFAKFEMTGIGALHLLQRLAANNIDQAVGRVIYTAMLDERGGIKADVTILRLAESQFMVLTGARAAAPDLAWMRRKCPADGSVQIVDASSAYCAIGLWGPRARDVLTTLADADISNAAFPYLTTRRIFVGHVPVLAVRISYVGELGWELYAPAEFGLALWDTLWAAGLPFGLAPVGDGAIDSLRLEKGYRAWGSDLHTEYTPFEAGLAFAVRMKKGDFIGRDALAGQAKIPVRRLCCLVLDNPEIVLMGKEPIFSGSGQRAIGHVTSANFGYSVRRSIAYGYLPVDVAVEGTRLEIYSFGQRHAATIAREPLFDPKNERLLV